MARGYGSELEVAAELEMWFCSPEVRQLVALDCPIVRGVHDRSRRVSKFHYLPHICVAEMLRGTVSRPYVIGKRFVVVHVDGRRRTRIRSDP